MVQLILTPYNHTKSLPTGLIFELLPQTDIKLPDNLNRKLQSTIILEEINNDSDSPFYHKIKTPTIIEGMIKDNSILRMIEHSSIDGSLSQYTRKSNLDFDGVKSILYPFWRAIKEVFSEDWELPPKSSRLLHGAGIIALGFLMDTIYDRCSRTNIPEQQEYVTDLKLIKPFCRWNSGIWEFGPSQQRRWDEIQNVSKDIRLLTNYIQYIYRIEVWDPQLEESKDYSN